MPNILHSFRASQQRPSVKGFSAKADTPQVPEPTNEVQQSAFNYMAQKNPALTDLVNRMDLMETGNPSIVTLISSPAQRAINIPAEALTPAALKRLQGLGAAVLEPGVSYSQAEAIAKVMAATNVTQERAESGLAMMLKESVVSLTPAGTYYLSDTVPF